MCLGCGVGALCCCNAFPLGWTPTKVLTLWGQAREVVRHGQLWSSVITVSLGKPNLCVTTLLLFEVSKNDWYYFLFLPVLLRCNWHGAVSLVNIPSSQTETTWKKQKNIYIVFPWNENSSGFLSWPLSHVTHTVALVVFITLHINLSRILYLGVCAFWLLSSRFPSSTPTSGNHRSDLFFYEFVCFWSIIDLPHYISPGCTTRQSDISLHFRMSPMVSLGIMSSHKDTMSSLTVTPHCTVHTHDSFVF